jgi:hypothetical protein
MDCGARPGQALLALLESIGLLPVKASTVAPALQKPLIPLPRTWVPAPWPAVCLGNAMSTLTFKVNRKSGEYVKPTLIPTNHSEQAHFGLLDSAIVGFFLICVCGLIYLLLHI